MEIIWFNIQEAYSYLTKHGEVFTLRDHKKKREGKMMLLSSLEGKPHYKGIVEVVFAKEIKMNKVLSKTTLYNYRGKSGFQTVEDWLKKAKKSKILYLYYVKVVKLNG